MYVNSCTTNKMAFTKSSVLRAHFKVPVQMEQNCCLEKGLGTYFSLSISTCVLTDVLDWMSTQHCTIHKLFDSCPKVIVPASNLSIAKSSLNSHFYACTFAFVLKGKRITYKFSYQNTCAYEGNFILILHVHDKQTLYKMITAFFFFVPC